MYLSLKSFSLDEYEELVAKSVVLEQDRRGIKVLQTPEGAIVKLFRLKRLLSSALLKSYASRFVENARALKKLGIKTVEVEEVLYCKSIKRKLVFYQPVPGQTLRYVLQNSSNTDDVMKKFTIFLAELHNKGILFRSIHLNNVIVSDTMDTLGLIDIADMRIYSKGLSKDMRMRNFRHLTRYNVDQESIKSFGVDRFMDIYFEVSQLPELYKKDFLTGIQQLMSEGGKV